MLKVKSCDGQILYCSTHSLAACEEDPCCVTHERIQRKENQTTFISQQLYSYTNINGQYIKPLPINLD